MRYKKICPNWVRPDKRANWIFNTTIDGYIYKRLMRYNRRRKRDDVRYIGHLIKIFPLPF